MPELGEGVTGVIELRQEILGVARIFVQHPGITPSAGYLASVAARLARKINQDKAAQGRKGNWDAARTALLVDISTAHLAQLLGQDGLATGSTMCRSTGKTCRSPPSRSASATSTV